MAVAYTRLDRPTATACEQLAAPHLYPADHGKPDWLEFDSMINVRPSVGNRTRSVEDPAVRDRIVAIVESMVVQ